MFEVGRWTFCKKESEFGRVKGCGRGRVEVKGGDVNSDEVKGCGRGEGEGELSRSMLSRLVLLFHYGA